jgi:hypothetical protein
MHAISRRDRSPILAAVGAVALAGILAAPAVRAADAPLTVLEPAATSPAEARKPERARWSWDQALAEVVPTGDLKWKPEPFRYEAGRVVRYIDYEHGSDDADGSSKDHAWKHHPWDAAASGKAKGQSGPTTYVFKRGVVYRGLLTAAESGAEGDPIRLTSDPSWGEGEAVIAGSERVASWTKGADNAKIPEADKVWWADLDFAPRCVWVEQGGTITRVELARTPNWTVSDPDQVRKEWWTFNQPGGGWTGQAQITFEGHRAHVGIDPKHLTQDEDYYKGAVAHVEYGIVMGTPFPTRVEGFDAKRKGIIFQGIWWGDSEKILSGCHYFLEDKPQYLDAPGEFWFEKKGAGGRLYLRLPGDADPNATGVEAAKRMAIIDSAGTAHLAISGLTFRFTNVPWDLVQPWWGEADQDNAAIRVRGGAEDVRIANCRFDDCAKAVRIDGTASLKGGGEKRDGSALVDCVVIADCDIDRTDHGAISLSCHSAGDVKVLRNHLHEIGLRTIRQDHSHAVDIDYPNTMDVSGNILERCTGAGLFLFGGKGDGDERDIPLTRYLVHHNKVIDSLLGANDWGGIETWWGGPFYVYDNISARPNGTWWGHDGKTPGRGSDGFAFYHDHGHKNYDFNDIAWGASDDWASIFGGSAGFTEASPTIDNAMFNCTVYRFWHGSNWSPAGGRHLFLGNVFDDIGMLVFRHGQLKEDKETPKGPYPHQSMAYARNVFSRVPDKVERDAKGQLTRGFAVYEVTGVGYDSPEAMAKSFDAHPALANDVGTLVPESPLMDPAKGDLRPKPGSAAIDHGVKVFVPWALARTVGEWQFRRDADPTRLLDDHWYMTPGYVLSEKYRDCPVNDLTAVGVTAADYIAGPLEDWTESALSFNGKDQYAALANADMAKPYPYEVTVGRGKNAHKEQKSAEGQALATPDVDQSSMIIEAYVLPKAAGCVLVSKLADAGYQLAINRAGGVTFTVVSGGAKSEVASGAKVVDGKWHHVLAELDRAAGTLAIYTDGKRTAQATCTLAAAASLTNGADFLVGKGPNGNFFAGALDFLRVTRSSLAESKTSIEELYDWELDGPFLRDFAGREPTGKCRDAGALEADGR